MNSINHFTFYRLPVILLFSLVLIQTAAADVIEDNGRTYLIDQTGERCLVALRTRGRPRSRRSHQ